MKVTRSFSLVNLARMGALGLGMTLIQAHAQLLNPACHQVSLPSSFSPVAFDSTGSVGVGYDSSDTAGNIYTLDVATGTLTNATKDAVAFPYPPDLNRTQGLPQYGVSSMSADGHLAFVYTNVDSPFDPATGYQVAVGGGPSFILDLTSGARTVVGSAPFAIGVVSEDGRYAFVDGSNGLLRINLSQPSDILDIAADIANAVGNGLTVADLFSPQNSSGTFPFNQAGNVTISGDGEIFFFSAGFDLLGPSPTTPLFNLRSSYNMLGVGDLAYRFDLQSKQLNYVAKVNFSAPHSALGVSTRLVLSDHITGTHGHLAAFARALPIVGTPDSETGGGGNQLYIADPVAQTVTQVTQSISPHGDVFAISFPHMTSDESEVFVSSDDNYTGQNPSGTYQMFRYDIAGKTMTQVTNYYDPLAALMQSLGLNNPDFTDGVTGGFLQQLRVDWTNPQGTLLELVNVGSNASATTSNTGGGIAVSGGAGYSNSGTNPPSTASGQLWDCR